MATVSTDKSAPADTTDERGRRHVFTGIVISDKTDKTRVVTLSRPYKHKKYEKVLHRRSKFYVHDEKNESKLGDTVEIMGTRPISKLKRWRLVKVLKAARKVVAEVSGGVE